MEIKDDDDEDERCKHGEAKEVNVKSGGNEGRPIHRESLEWVGAS